MDLREKFALVVCEATQKTNYKCEFDCKTKGKCAYCLVMAEQMIAHGVTVQNWISVKDRLPECDQVVLCYKADRGVRTGKHLAATYADGVSAFKDCCRDYAFGATHWMPLPQPPKGE